MSAPLNGDRLAIEADIADGARLTVDSAAATVALPGARADGEPSTYTVELGVGRGPCCTGSPSSSSPPA